MISIFYFNSCRKKIAENVGSSLTISAEGNGVSFDMSGGEKEITVYTPENWEVGSVGEHAAWLQFEAKNKSLKLIAELFDSWNRYTKQHLSLFYSLPNNIYG